MMVRYKNGAIEFTTETEEYRLTDIAEVNLLCDKIRWHRDNSQDELTFRKFTIALDMLLSAKDELLRYCESRNLLIWAC